MKTRKYMAGDIVRHIPTGAVYTLGLACDEWDAKVMPLGASPLAVSEVELVKAASFEQRYGRLRTTASSYGSWDVRERARTQLAKGREGAARVLSVVAQVAALKQGQRLAWVAGAGERVRDVMDAVRVEP